MSGSSVKKWWPFKRMDVKTTYENGVVYVEGRENKKTASRVVLEKGQSLMKPSRQAKAVASALSAANNEVNIFRR